MPVLGEEVTGVLVFDGEPDLRGLIEAPQITGVLLGDPDTVGGVLVFDREPQMLGVVDASAGGGVLVFDALVTTVGQTGVSSIGAVVVFDGEPTIGAITRQVVPGVAIAATTGPRGPQGPTGPRGPQGHPGYVLVEPGEQPPPGTPDGTFVFEHVT